MKRVSILLLFVFASLSNWGQQARKVVFIIADGIPRDVIKKVSTPALDAIAGEGGFAPAHVGGGKGEYSQTPTISAVGYNSLLTGTWVNKHNVWDNDIKAPNYNYWNLFRFLKFYAPSRTAAIFSAWQDNRTKLIGEGLAEAGSIHLDYHVDGLELDTVRYPHDENSQYMHEIDEEVASEAGEYISSKGPDLTWIYLEYTDDMGHRYGDSEQFYGAVRYLDAQVKRIWDAINYRKKEFNEDWVIFITTDHGRDAKTGRNHGGQSDRERNTWIVSNASDLNNYFRDYEPGIVDIMPSIARFLDLQIPRNQLMEIDGVPLIGRVSAILPQALLKDGKIELRWTALEKSGNARIWLATTNQFKSGGEDPYQLVAEIPLKNEKAVIDVRSIPSSFYKLVIETPGNFLNRWIIPEK